MPEFSEKPDNAGMKNSSVVTRLDGEGSLLELCKKLKFDHTDKWYMHYPDPVLDNEKHKILWGFAIQMYHLISARRLDLVIVSKKKKKRTYRITSFAAPADLKVRITESEKKDKYQHLARELKNL